MRTYPALEAEDAYRNILREGRARDRAAGRTLVGPQASDLAVRHGPKDIPAHTASTGEQKALLIGLVMAHARLVAAMSGLPAQGYLMALGLFVAALVAGMAMFALGWIGGGDAKLFAACGLWLGGAAIFPFLAWTAIAGGGLAVGGRLGELSLIQRSRLPRGRCKV